MPSTIPIPMYSESIRLFRLLPTDVAIAWSVRLCVRLYVCVAICPSVTLTLKPLDGTRCHLAGRRREDLGVGTPSQNYHCKLRPNRNIMAEWLLQSAYRNSAMPYPSVPSPTPYDSPFSQVTVRSDAAAVANDFTHFPAPFILVSLCRLLFVVM